MGGTTRAPPRALPPRLDPRGNYFKLIPFGAGRWICAGKPAAGTAGKLDLCPPATPAAESSSRRRATTEALTAAPVRIR